MDLVVWLLLSIIVLLCLAAALLWWEAQRATRRRIEREFVDTQLEIRTVSGDQVIVDEYARSPQLRTVLFGPKSWSFFFLRAGVTPTSGFYLGHAAVVLAAGLVGLFFGVFTTIALLLSTGVLVLFRLWLKVERRRKAMVRQIPDFLDRVVRMVTVGSSMGAAFHQAANNSVSPLDEVMGRVTSLHRSGQDLDQCIRQVSHQYGLQELYLIAAVVGVAMRFGGRSDHVLERMAAFMRDLEQARNELIAMSAELRLSAWILTLLPLGIACFILIFNNALFMGMWHDPVGTRLLIGAAVLQVVGTYWLYRLAKSV